VDEGWRVRKDGGRFWADAFITALRNEAGHLRGFVKITRDITERKRTEAKILRQTAVLEGINRIFQDALRCETEEDLGRTCLAVAEAVTASKFGFLGEINPTTGLLNDIAISDPGWEVCRIEPSSGSRRPPLHFQIHGIYGRVLLDGRGFFTNDPETHPDRIGVPAGHPPLTAFLGVPFVRDGQTFGMVGVGNRDGGYGQEELEALEALAPAMVEAISRNRAEAALHRLNQELDQRVRARTVDLEAANKELEAFCYSVSHDLRAPLRGMDGFSQALLEFYEGQLDAQGRDWLNRIRAGCQRMGQLIDDLLRLSRLTRAEMRCRRIDLTAMAREIAAELRETAPERSAEFRIDAGLTAVGDPQLLRPALRNLLENAWKFASKRPTVVIELGRAPAPLPTDPAAAPDPAHPHPGETTYFVRDNGAGFDMAYADKLFGPFQRLHSVKDYPGNGIGLALVQRVVHRHGGRIWAESAPDQGATFYFTLNELGGEHDA
jgi:signal transduction histidine kinase